MNLKIPNRRSTKQREIVLNELKALYTHPTALELFKIINKKFPNIGVATVYRNLELLQQEGIIIKLNSREKEAHYDGDITPHLHLICKKCGEIFDIDDCNKINIRSEKIEKIGFKPDFRYLEIHGICKNCQN